MKTLRRPMRSASQPQTIGADDGADAGTHEHGGRLAEGQLPRADQEGEHEADQEVVEEFQRVADDGGGEDPDLVAGQTCAAIEYLEHGVVPLAHVLFRRASRLRSGNGGKASRSGRRTEERQLFRKRGRGRRPTGGLARDPERNPTERRTGRASSVGARMAEAGIHAAKP